MNVKVCIGDYCHLHGAEVVVQTFQRLLERYDTHGQIQLKGCFCIRHCTSDGVAVQVKETVHKVLPEDAEQFFQTIIQPALTA